MGEIISNTIEQLLSEKLGVGKKVTNLEISNLPPKGITSVLLKVTVTIQDRNSKEEQLYLVAKTLTNFEFETDRNSTEFIFKKEANFYDIIVPTLKEFQREEGVSNAAANFAEFYGANYDVSGKGEKDTLILLEDLCAKGTYGIIKNRFFRISYRMSHVYCMFFYDAQFANFYKSLFYCIHSKDYFI